MNKEILSVYRRILRVARSWKASSGRAEDTLEERKYIANECRELFRQNSKVFCCFILLLYFARGFARANFDRFKVCFKILNNNSNCVYLGTNFVKLFA